jgi:hypothetical protein
MLFVLVQVVAINIKTDSLKTSNNNQNQKTINDIMNSFEFKEGTNYALTIIRICVFKMWQDQEILDFDNIDESIKANLTEITSNPEKLKEWNQKYSEYLNSKKDDK